MIQSGCPCRIYIKLLHIVGISLGKKTLCFKAEGFYFFFNVRAVKKEINVKKSKASILNLNDEIFAR